MNNRSLDKPSPLAFMNPNAPMVPQQVTPNSPPSSKNLRNALIGDFIPKQDTFR
jgi:hypothetical protein